MRHGDSVDVAEADGVEDAFVGLGRSDVGCGKLLQMGDEAGVTDLDGLGESGGSAGEEEDEGGREVPAARAHFRRLRLRLVQTFRHGGGGRQYLVRCFRLLQIWRSGQECQ